MTKQEWVKDILNLDGYVTDFEQSLTFSKDFLIDGNTKLVWFKMYPNEKKLVLLKHGTPYQVENNTYSQFEPVKEYFPENKTEFEEILKQIEIDIK